MLHAKTSPSSSSTVDSVNSAHVQLPSGSVLWVDSLDSLNQAMSLISTPTLHSKRALLRNQVPFAQAVASSSSAGSTAVRNNNPPKSKEAKAWSSLFGDDELSDDDDLDEDASTLSDLSTLEAELQSAQLTATSASSDQIAVVGLDLEFIPSGIDLFQMVPDRPQFCQLMSHGRSGTAELDALWNEFAAPYHLSPEEIEFCATPLPMPQMPSTQTLQISLIDSSIVIDLIWVAEHVRALQLSTWRLGLLRHCLKLRRKAQIVSSAGYPLSCPTLPMSRQVCDLLDRMLTMLLANTLYIKCGSSFGDDLRRLHDEFSPVQCSLPGPSCTAITLPGLSCFMTTCTNYVELSALPLQSLSGLSITTPNNQQPNAPTGLARLSSALLNVQLDKREQLSAFYRRPLTSSQLHYCAMDAWIEVALLIQFCQLGGSITLSTLESKAISLPGEEAD